MASAAGNVAISNEHASAVLSPSAGAALRSLRVNVRDSEYELLCGGVASAFDPLTLPHGTGSFIMAPWPNRIPGGALATPAGEHILESDGELHTIHGLVRDLEWEVTQQEADSVRMEVGLPDPWPDHGRVIYEARLHGQSLVQALSVESKGQELPAGVGWHPWFRSALGTEQVSISLDAIEAWELDDQMTPSGATFRPPLLEALQDGTRLHPGSTDDCLRISPGTQATLTWPELTLGIVGSESINHMMIYTPPDGSALCVEPQTACVNAFQLHARGIENTGTQFIAPGMPLSASTTWSWR